MSLEMSKNPKKKGNPAPQPLQRPSQSATPRVAPTAEAQPPILPSSPTPAEGSEALGESLPMSLAASPATSTDQSMASASAQSQPAPQAADQPAEGSPPEPVTTSRAVPRTDAAFPTLLTPVVERQVRRDPATQAAARPQIPGGSTPPMTSEAEAAEQMSTRRTLQVRPADEQAAASRAPFEASESTLARETQAVAKEPVSRPALAESDDRRPDLAPDGRPWHEVFMRPGIPKMYIVQIASELAPVAKVGGLADVVFGLSRELEIRGNEVEIILPKYDCLRYRDIYNLVPVFLDLWVPWAGGSIHCTVFFGFVHGRKCFFIEPHDEAGFFRRGHFYGSKDDVQRFAFFSRAALEFLLKSGKRPQIVHCHDWQTALVPVYLWEIYHRLGMGGLRVCYTIHNFRHQGICGFDFLKLADLHRPEHFARPERLLDNHNSAALNLMKGGIVYSNFVTTVSPRHAAEARDQNQGFGLEPTLHAHGGKYGGVLNGIDYEVFNPETDRHLPHHFSATALDGKYANKKALRQRLWLADNEKPIIAFIGRLDPQKGLDLVRHALFYAINHGAQFVLLGSSPESGINDYFWQLKHYLNENPDSHIEVGFNEELAHLIYAGADMMVVPSRFEPCGLTQLISMRYGTIPLVRSVGGLADTVFDKDYSSRPSHERNGYVFHQDDNPAIESALSRAIACYYEFPQDFRSLIGNAMRSDFSWNVPAQHYLNIYDHIRAK